MNTKDDLSVVSDDVIYEENDGKGMKYSKKELSRVEIRECCIVN